jgi:hypothetical protein
MNFEGKALRLPKQDPELFWEVSPPEPGQTYRVNWDWLPVSSKKDQSETS